MRFATRLVGGQNRAQFVKKSVILRNNVTLIRLEAGPEHHFRRGNSNVFQIVDLFYLFFI